MAQQQERPRPKSGRQNPGKTRQGGQAAEGQSGQRGQTGQQRGDNPRSREEDFDEIEEEDDEEA